MREILFRGKSRDTNKWVFGDFFTDACGILHKEYFYGYGDTGDIMTYVIPETIGQYTGLTDKNGKKIFEGDVCRFREWNNGDMCWIGKVNYKHQQFVISGGKNKECATPFTLVMSRFIPKNIEVIGNIHDNPDLIGGADE